MDEWKLKKKKVWVFEKICPKCNEVISGNGSGFEPYRCKCGQWGFDSEELKYKPPYSLTTLNNE